jgi:cytochrome c oxidase cbb3-type subunit 3
MRALILAVAAAAIGAAATACSGDNTSVASAATPPPNAYFIGPQPGPDRTFTQVQNPYDGDKTVLADGRRLFVWYNCAGCHGDHAGGGMGPSLRDSLWYYGGDEASIFASITEGRQHGMPAWGSKLPESDIWKIVTYIKSLRTPDEPDPPR